MIYLFEHIPINVSPDQQIMKAFSKLKMNSTDFQTIQAVEHEKQGFYAFFNKVHHDKNFLPKIQEIEMNQKYLERVFDLMRLGIKADYVIQ